ncbi:hypothetical protein THAOC_06103 [Thalassiosira oceanica]|uniref:Uncharacterized protein n=1 Tax=Thalassiosira oceanica TaxID=159749 RepID=K0T159_THAOC|nr:hypothetical protein THAOC_06103 [Thalassiosira oceanica]|eukprot:EJK72368.1 hypothetical protein THAOC_06103 [Thalassiosira oceanica]
MLLDAKGRLGGCVVHRQPLLSPGPTPEDVFHDATSETIVLVPRVEEPISWAVLVQPLDDAHLSVGSKADLFLHHEDNSMVKIVDVRRVRDVVRRRRILWLNMAGATWSPS